MLVEAKALRHPVTDQHLGQCVSYAAVLGVEWCLVTNGKTWIVCNAHAKGPLEAKKVAEVVLGGTESETADAWSTLSLFARDSLMQANPLTELLVERVVVDELGRGDSPAVTALRKAVRDRFGVTVPPQAVLKSIRFLRHPEPTSLPSAPAPGTPTGTPAIHPVRAPRRNDDAADGSSGPVTLAVLLAAGLINEGDRVEARLYGVTHVGRVSDGGIEVDGNLYRTPSAAASALRGGKASNGWVIWTSRGRLLSELRAELAARGPGAAESGATSN